MVVIWGVCGPLKIGEISTVGNPPSEIRNKILYFLALLGAPININVGLSDKNLFTSTFQQKSDNFDLFAKKILVGNSTI